MNTIATHNIHLVGQQVIKLEYERYLKKICQVRKNLQIVDLKFQPTMDCGPEEDKRKVITSQGLRNEINTTFQIIALFSGPK